MGGLPPMQQQNRDTITGMPIVFDQPFVGAEGPIMPKIMVMGHGRHGKDTVGEWLRDKYGMSFTSSSLFCAEHVMMPAFRAIGVEYPTAEKCYKDRHRDDNRAFWYDNIRAFNTPDLTALGRAIFERHDVYCGIRHHSEFNALKNAGVFDLSVWVDAHERMPSEAASSISVEPWMADYVLDNNGSLEDLERNLASLFEARIRRLIKYRVKWMR